MPENERIGRFPMPTIPWVTQQLPAQLYPLFGFRGEQIPEKSSEEIEYLYELKYPDGSLYLIPVLMEYTEEDDPAVAFIIDGTIRIGGVEVVVKDWSVRAVPPVGGMHPYTYHRVIFTLPPEGQNG